MRQTKKPVSIQALLDRVTLELLLSAKAKLSELGQQSNSDPIEKVKLAILKESGINRRQLDDLFDPSVDETVRGYFGVVSGNAEKCIKGLVEAAGNPVQAWRRVVDDTISRVRSKTK